MIVDDETLIRKSIKNLLNSINLKSEEAEDGLEALKMIEERFDCKKCAKFKLIFMDIYMPNMDGFQTCSELLNFFDSDDIDENIVKPNIIICSAHDVNHIRENISNNYLVKSFIGKPINKSKLLDSLKILY